METSTRKGTGGIVEVVVHWLHEQGDPKGNPKPPHLDLFNGDGQSNVDDWVFHVNQYFELMEM